MSKFLITILVIVGVYYAIKYLVRFLFPFIVNRFVNKMMGGTQNPFNQQQPEMKKEGEVTITQKPKSTKHQSEKDDDFVDFEEV